MKFAKLLNGAIVAHGDAATLWPTTGFGPGGPDANFLAGAGAVEIEQPAYDAATQALAPCDPYVSGSHVYDATVRALTPAELAPRRYQALLDGGLTITSTGTPAISGIYPVSDQIEQDLAAEEASILASGGSAFSTGETTLTWPLVSGATVSLTVDQFKVVGLALAKFYTQARQALRQQQATNVEQTWPAAAVTIA